MLPESPNRVYGTDTPVHPGDMDDLQEGVSDLWAGKHGDLPLVLSAAGWRGTGTVESGPVRFVDGGSTFIVMSIPGIVGRRIKSVSFSAKGNAANDIGDAFLVKTTMAGVDTTLESSGVLNNVPVAWTTYTIDIDPDASIAAGESVSLVVAPIHSSIEYGNVAVTYDHP